MNNETANGTTGQQIKVTKIEDEDFISLSPFHINTPTGWLCECIIR